MLDLMYRVSTYNSCSVVFVQCSDDVDSYFRSANRGRRLLLVPLALAVLRLKILVILDATNVMRPNPGVVSEVASETSITSTYERLPKAVLLLSPSQNEVADTYTSDDTYLPGNECPVFLMFRRMFFSFANLNTAFTCSAEVALTTYAGYRPCEHPLAPALGSPATLLPVSSIGLQLLLAQVG